MKDKHFIIGEIQRTAALNNGRPLGQNRFQTETGIAPHEWMGVYWARWSDALKWAGFEPLQWGSAMDEDLLFKGLIKLVREYGRIPTSREMSLERRSDEKVPSNTTIRDRFGSRAEVTRKLREYCSTKTEYEDVMAILDSDLVETGPLAEAYESVARKNGTPSGYVYLVQSGKLYKIGHTTNRWQRMSQLDRQTFDGIEKLIHMISAYDDAPGIEAYWHKRFEGRHVRNEIFDLTADDIKAFKKRKWM